MALLKALVDKLLTNASRGLFNTDESFIAPKILTQTQAPQYSGKIGKYGKSHLRVVNAIMGGRGEAQRVHIDLVDSDTFYIEPHGLSTILTKQDYRNYEIPFDAEIDAVKYLLSMMKLAREKALADALTSSSVLTQYTTLTTGTQYNDWNTSNPLGDAKTARAAIYDGAGVAPNKVVMSWKVFDTLRYHPQILENLGFTRARAGQLSLNDMGMALDVDEVLIGSAVYNTTALGQTDTLGGVWGKSMIFLYSPTGPSLRQQSLGFSIFPTGEGNEPTIFKYQKDNPPGSQEVIAVIDYDDLVTDVYCGYLISAAIS